MITATPRTVREAMPYGGPVEYLATGEAGSLPDSTSIKQYFNHFGHVDHVKETDEGLVVMFNNTRTVWQRMLLTYDRHTTAFHGTSHDVDGHRVKVHLLCPDVYSCEVNVTRHRVSVTVGHEVIRRIKQDEEYKQLIQTLPNDHSTSDEVMISFGPNHIEVQLLKTNSRNSSDLTWDWELCVLQHITTFLKPFKDLLLQTIKHTSYRERRIYQECRKETHQSKCLDTHDGEAIAVSQFTDEGLLHVASSEDTLKQLRQSYPTIDISCDTGMKALTLRGPARAVYQAREDTCSLVKNMTTNRFIFDRWKIQVLNNPDAHKCIQQNLNKENISCCWEICEREDFFSSVFVIKVTALQKDQPRVQQVFESSIQTIKVHFDKNQKSSLQSDAWKLCLERLQTRREGEPALVVDDSENGIAITGFAVNIESSRRAVLGFFHRNVIQTYPRLYGQEVEEVIRGLKPWQMKLLMTINLIERIVAELPDLALLDVQSDSLVIKAPLHVLTESVSVFWRLVASLSQKQIHLTTALAEMYKQSAARSKIQTLLKAAGLSCQWEVEDDHITVGAEDADQELLKQIFTSTFSEASVHVEPEKSHLLRSEDFQALVTELQERKSGFPTPVIQTSSGNNGVVIVDDSESCSTVQRAIEKLFENHDVLTTTSHKETQRQSPQQTEVKDLQTENRHQQTEGKNFCSTEQQTDTQLENKEIQTQESRVKEQSTERPRLTENGFQTDKITTKEQQLQTDQSQLESTGQQTDDSKKATNDKRVQTERGNVQVEVIHPEEKHHQTEVKHSQSTAQQTENRQLKNAELQTDDSRVLTVETQTEGATFTERGFQTEHLETDEKQLQTDQRESNSKQQQTESKATENKESQSASNTTTTTENQTQTEGQRTEGQTEESNTRAHAQGEECELIENPGTATLVPESLDNAGPSSQTELTRNNEAALSVNQFQVQMVQTRNVQSQAHQCPVEVPSRNQSSVHADSDTYTCVDEIQAEESTSDDESQTFPMKIIESEVEMGLDTRTQTSVPSCREALPQHLSCLLELCAHLGVSPEHLQHLQSSCTDPEDLMRNLVDRCIAASDSTGLLLAVLRLFVRTDDTNTSRNFDTRGLPALQLSAVATTPQAAVRNLDEHPDQSQSPEVVASGWRVSAETAQAAYPPLSSTEGSTFSETQPFSAALYSEELSESHNNPTQNTVEPERGIASHGRQSLSRTDQHLEPAQMPMTLRMAQMQMSPSSPIRLNQMPSSPFQANVDLCLEIHLPERPATDTNALMQVFADTVDNLRRDVDMYIHNELPVDNFSNSSSELSHEALE